MMKAMCSTLKLSALALLLLVLPLAVQAETGPSIGAGLGVLLPVYGDTMIDDMDMSMKGQIAGTLDLGYQFEWLGLGLYGGYALGPQPLWGGTEGNGSQYYYGLYGRFIIPLDKENSFYLQGGAGYYGINLDNYDWGDMKAGPDLGYMAGGGIMLWNFIGIEATYHWVNYEEAKFDFSGMPSASDSAKGDFVIVGIRIGGVLGNGSGGSGGTGKTGGGVAKADGNSGSGSGSGSGGSGSGGSGSGGSGSGGSGSGGSGSGGSGSGSGGSGSGGSGSGGGSTSNGGGTVPAILPRIACASSMKFTADAGQAASDQALALNNGGKGVINYSIDTNRPWLGVSPSSGDLSAETDSIIVSASCSGLAAGTYNGAIQINAPGAANNPLTVPVTLVCLEPPKTIELRSEMLFKYNSAELLPEAKTALMEVVKILRDNPQTTAKIEGFTCDRGSEEYNLALSQRRAQSVVDFLVASGIDAGRLTATGFGEASPKMSNDTEAHRAQNRRVAIKIYGLKQ